MGKRSKSRRDHRLQVVPPRQKTGFLGKHWRRVVPRLRPGFHVARSQPLTGDAPKDLLHVYEFGRCTKANADTWPLHIAKVGHKWYPAESVTEQLMTRIGEIVGFRVAESCLMAAGDQIRFLSRYFLRPEESLVHGAEIVAGYLEDDEFVAAVGEQQLERDIFTFQAVCSAIRTAFPAEERTICFDLVRLLAFDCLVGNQDRHLYNWGVIVHARGKRPPQFAPIYDTARGLFWNKSDEGLSRFGTEENLSKYVSRGLPLIGWDGEAAPVNHFGLISRICSSDPAYRSILQEIRPLDRLGAIREILRVEFDELLSSERCKVIFRCLAKRFEEFEVAIAGGVQHDR